MAVVMAMYVTAAAGCRRGASRRTRVIALALFLAAAPAMIVYDNVSQYRWRKATFASAPQVLPVITAYRVTGTRGNGPVLGVDMTGPTDLEVTVTRCRACAMRRIDGYHELTIVDGTYRLDVRAFPRPGAGLHWPPQDVGTRPASRDELARLPLAVASDD